VESRVLNFVDAMKLAQKLQGKFDTVSDETTLLDLVSNLITTLSAEEIIEVSLALIDSTKERVLELSSSELLDILCVSCSKNNLGILLESYKQLGFG